MQPSDLIYTHPSTRGTNFQDVNRRGRHKVIHVRGAEGGAEVAGEAQGPEAAREPLVVIWPNNYITR